MTTKSIRYIIKDAIDNWDPIELLSFCPDDEYDREINDLVRLYNNCDTVDTLTDKINDVFLKWFGDDVYTEDKEKCSDVARYIIESINTTSK